MREFAVTASLDCWGPRQEYARFPLDLKIWEENFEFLLKHDWVKIVIGSTITPLTIKTFPDLVEKINHWNQQRPVSHYFNSVNSPSHMMINIVGDIFDEDFQRALSLMPEDTREQKNIKNYLAGIAVESRSKNINVVEALKLKIFLDELDRRRKTNWRTTFPELVKSLDSLG